MKKQNLFLMLTVLALFGALLFAAPQLVSAGSLSQSSYATPTPNADGQIIYTVEEGDSCTRIFLLTDAPIEQIIQLNNLDEDCSLTPGQQLVIATVAPATATPEGPTPTPTQRPPPPPPHAHHRPAHPNTLRWECHGLRRAL
jgi:hypothetical protein